MTTAKTMFYGDAKVLHRIRGIPIALLEGAAEIMRKVVTDVQQNARNLAESSMLASTVPSDINRGIPGAITAHVNQGNITGKVAGTVISTDPLENEDAKIVHMFREFGAGRAGAGASHPPLPIGEDGKAYRHGDIDDRTATDADGNLLEARYSQPAMPFMTPAGERGMVELHDAARALAKRVVRETK